MLLGNGCGGMEPVISDRTTAIIQAALIVIASTVSLFAAFAFDYAPAWATQPLYSVAFVFLVIFAWANVIPAILYGINLVFYQIQVYRHGKPHEQFETD